MAVRESARAIQRKANGMTADPETTLRADARRNRDQILAAAKNIFAVSGPEVPMEEIARAAGVGVGTLYRRFPDRDALVRAVAMDNFERVLIDARVIAAEETSSWRALERLLRQSVELQLSVQLAMVSHRALVILKYSENYSYEELAEIFGLSESACKMRVSRARDKIQQKFGDSA